MQKTFFQKIKDLFFIHKKIFIFSILAIVFISFFILRSNGSSDGYVDTVRYTNLDKTVKSTGQIVSNTDLDLSFNKSGIVRSVKVNVGDEVKAGQVLASLDQGQVSASLTQARAALLSAKAKYEKVLEGSSTEEIALAEIALRSAQIDLQNIKNKNDSLVSTAYKAMLNSSLAAFPDSSFSSSTAPVISGTYVYDTEGDIKISTYQGGSWYFSTSGLVHSSGYVSETSPQPIGDSGLFIQFSSPSQYSENWVISIPNKKASNYLTNYNAYKSAIENRTSAISSAQSLVDQRQAELNLKKASARSADIDIAKAEVLSAEGNVQSAESAYEDSIIRAPADGTITRVDIKYGELADAGKAVITLEDVKNLYIEALINEANIAYLKIGQVAEVTFDAFGNAIKFTGKVAHIDPSAETNEGVVNYKIKVSINEKDDTIRPGMNANVNILAGEAKNILAISNTAIFKKGNTSFVTVVRDDENKKGEEKEVKTGFLGDNNMIEIISGLSAGEKVLLLQNK